MGQCQSSSTSTPVSADKRRFEIAAKTTKGGPNHAQRMQTRMMHPQTAEGTDLTDCGEDRGAPIGNVTSWGALDLQCLQALLQEENSYRTER